MHTQTVQSQTYLFDVVQKMPAWFPGARFKSYAKKVRPEVGEAVKNRPWDDFVADVEVSMFSNP